MFAQCIVEIDIIDAKSSFYWNLERVKAFVDMTYGPKYGCGYVYDIKIDGDNIILDNEQLKWVS